MKHINEEYIPILAEFENDKVFEYISELSGHKRNKEVRRLATIAQEIKFHDFKKLLKSYEDEQKPKTDTIYSESGLTDFSEQPLELNTGDWRADDMGIWRYGSQGGIELACSHMVMPTQRLRNIDTGELKAKIVFRRGSKNRRALTEITTPFSTISSAKNIITLASVGVSVTSGKRAQNLVDYLTDIMDKNYDFIPEYKSTSRMGWNEEGFSPYVQDVVFDGADSFGRTFKAIAPHGEPTSWLLEAKEARQYSITARILLAASFASVLVEPLGCLPFFLHLWGMDSGTGKTVGMMLAAAVWADPSVGGAYLQTFKSTSVGVELTAGFLNSLPLFLDELQLSKDHRGRVAFNVYELAAGKGKTRATKELGLAQTPSWANCFITSGETPIVSETDGAGALNRVIEIECKASELVINDGHRTANAVRESYGHAGREFISHLIEAGEKAKAQQLYSDFYETCIKRDTTSKQAMAAAILVTADTLATEWIFKDNRAITIEEIGEFLKTKAAVSLSDRGYHIMCDWVSQNANKLRGATNDSETYGAFGTGENSGWVYIIRSTFDKVCVDNGVSPKALLSHLLSADLIHRRGRALTVSYRLGQLWAECVKMKLPSGEDGECADDEGEDLPL